MRGKRKLLRRKKRMFWESSNYKEKKIGRKTRTESTVRVEQIKLPAFVGHKQSPNLISYHAFKLPFLDFLWTRNAVSKKRIFLRLVRNGKPLKMNQAKIAEELRGFSGANILAREIIEEPPTICIDFGKFYSVDRPRLNRICCLKTFLRLLCILQLSASKGNCSIHYAKS